GRQGPEDWASDIELELELEIAKDAEFEFEFDGGRGRGDVRPRAAPRLPAGARVLHLGNGFARGYAAPEQLHDPRNQTATGPGEPVRAPQYRGGKRQSPATGPGEVLR